MTTPRILAAMALVAIGAACGDTITPPPIIVIADLGPPAPTVTVTGKYSVVVGKTETLTATTQNAADATYTWTSSNETVAKVDAKGVVTGVAAGEVEISAKGATSNVSGKHGMTVVALPPPLTPAVTVTGEYVVITYTSTKLTATTTNATDAGYDWTSSDVKIATVGTDGTVKGVTPGKVTITAKGKDSKASGSLGIVISNEVPHLAEWLSSKHADKAGVPFTDWDTAMPMEIPTTCARCHSQYGFRDYLGDDGSAPWIVDKPAAIGSVVDCTTCHNAAATVLSQVTFPSGVTIKGLGAEARCETCHQGREATDTLDATIKAAAAKDDDTVSAGLGFKNIHYFAAGATLNANRTRGGYQYAGKIYDARFRHVPERDTCIECHNPHTLQLDLVGCAKCHAGVVTKDDLKKIRMMSSLTSDYDGDGDKVEGIAGEIDGLREKLLVGMKAYVVAKALDKLCYSAVAYPYFFKDTNGDGNCDVAEAVNANKYASWTNRLMRASYNYQVSLKDPGAFAHNAKYIIELLFDSIENVNGGLPMNQQVDLSKCVRTDVGHFNGSGEPARHWDQQGAVDQTCAQCHGGSEGFRFYLKYGIGFIGTEPDNGLDCYTCHEKFGPLPADFTLVSVPSVTFPSKLVVKADAMVGANLLNGTSMICMTCHQGRESKSTVDAANAVKPGFRNVHYLAAGATLMGKEAQVGYEYAGQTYAGRWNHTGGINCTGCHSGKNTKHTFAVADNITACNQVCHIGATKATDIRLLRISDYNGNGNTSESLAAEHKGVADKVLAQMQVVAKANSGGVNGICYNGAAYPYWFKDTNNNNVCDGMEAINANAFAPWTAQLSKAAFNYQFYSKEPGAWAHNFTYMGQLLYDTLVDLGGSTMGLTRP